MRKRNKKAIIVSAIIMLIGILLVLAGFFGGWFISLFSKDFDYKNIQPDDLGKIVRTDIFVYYDDGMTEWSCVYNLDDFTVTVCLDGDYANPYTFSAEEFR